MSERNRYEARNGLRSQLIGAYDKCPRCEAPSGELCRKPNGVIADHEHRHRPKRTN